MSGAKAKPTSAGRELVELAGDKGRRFEEDIICRPDEGGKGADFVEDRKEGVSNGVVNRCFMRGEACAEVVAIGIKSLGFGFNATWTGLVVPKFRKSREAEFALQKELEEIVRETVVSVLPRKAMKGVASEWVHEGREKELQ